jgi:hypothetical protein
VKRCCNVLIGEQCDCREFEAEARAALTGRNAIMCRPASQWNRDPATALGIALHRDGGVVFDRVIEAESFSKAAKKAERLTAEDGDFRGFSVYSITRGYTS